MSSIDRLKIQGVRSFDNKSAEYIRFEAPLTLIVGYNGSGKTTVIECLKYATMGMLPPNSKTGGTFVHDPKLCGEKEVLAQVKLQCKNATGANIVVTRSLQVNATKTGVTQKTRENNVMIEDKGERKSYSSKIFDLDSIMSDNLGVSPAILESVIFCHQDDSLWPMSEAGALKKKFDNIFEAQQYTKAIENLKSLRKGKVEQGKLFKQQEEHDKMIKNKAEKAQKRMQDIFDEIEAYRIKAGDLKQEMVTAKALETQKRKQANEALRYVQDLQAKTDQVAFLQKHLLDLRTNMEVLNESDEWLESMLAEYEERMAQYVREQEQLTVDYLKLQKEIENSRKGLSAKVTEEGRRQAAKDTYEQQITARADLVKEAARNHSMRGYDGDLGEEEVQDFMTRVQRLLQDKRRELDRVKKQAEDEQSMTQGVINDLSTQKATCLQEKAHARQIMTSNGKKLILKQRDVDAMTMDEGTMASLNSNVTDVQKRLQDLTNTYTDAEWDAKINAESTRLRELDAEMTRLRNELVQSNKLATARAQLEYTMKEAKDERDKLDVMKSTYNNRLAALIGPDWTVSGLESEFQTVLDTRTQDLADAKKQQQSMAEQLSEFTVKLKSHRENLSKKEDEKRKCQDVVLSSITDNEGKAISSVDEYETELKDLTKYHDDTQKDVDGKQYVAEFYTKCRDTANKFDACRLCKRGFANAGERVSAVEKINKELAKYATQAMEQELQETSIALKKANSARSQYERYNSLATSEIPSIKTDIKDIEAKIGPLTLRLERRDAEVNKIEASKRDAESLGSNVSKIITHAAQVLKHEANITLLSSQAKTSGSSLSAEEIQDLSATCDEKTRLQKSKVEKLQSEKASALATLRSVEHEAAKYSAELKSAQHSMANKQACLDDIAELRDNNTKQEKIIETANHQLEDLEPQEAKANAQHNDAKERGRVKEKEVQASKDKLTATVGEFQLINKAIDGYVESGGAAKLKACQGVIKGLEQEIQDSNARLSEIGQKNNELKKLVDDGANTKRSINDNIKYRKGVQESKDLERDIAHLRARNDADDYENLSREAEEATKRFDMASSSRSGVVATMAALDREYERNTEEWELDYKNAAPKYRESHIRVATNEAACDDLSKFTKALDQAIMEYHTNKMREINAVAADLWRSTYQGTDVDTIMIRSENEDKSSSKRNYNYRVVMVKQDAEMDMRGRCSAGQRVLACIVIRLALAECFGVNCGVIALDEPTTNLDSDNIKALASSLNQIIQQRKQQKNFQIIIITHDEEFLKAMRCSDFTDSYWRVSRNAEQKSKIRQHPIAEIL